MPYTTQDMITHIQLTYSVGIEIIKRKNADYAGDTDPFRNFRTATVVGVPVERAILVRLMDKISRVSTLLDKDPAVVEESLEDTLIDAINYLGILKAYLASNSKSKTPSILEPKVPLSEYRIRFGEDARVYPDQGEPTL